MNEPLASILEERLDAIKEAMLANQEQNGREHTAILEQTKKTNGRVTSLEQAKNMVWGGLIITNIIIVPVAIALFIMYLKK